MSIPDDHALSFWSQRWAAGQIGFHEAAPSDLLIAHFGDVASDPGARVFVPLAGKSLDLRWLAERGHDVTGIELVPLAVEAFFDEWQVTPERLELGGMKALRARGVTLVCGDVFDASAEALGHFDLLYDRGALIAIAPPLRAAYVATCASLLAKGAVTLLVSLGYDQARVAGPPFSVDEASVRSLYAPRAVARLSSRQAPTSPRVAASGVAAFEENVYRIA